MSRLHGEYEEEFGYKLEWRKLGFSCLEDLFTSDVEAVALFRLTPELGGWVVMLKEEGCEDYSSFRRNIIVPKPVQVNCATYSRSNCATSFRNHCGPFCLQDHRV